MKRLSFFGALTLALTAAVAWADNWPNWRGPDDNGISKDVKLPTEWSATKNIAWKLAMPDRGGSTPAVWGDRLFVTCQEGKDIILLCIGTEGKQKWKRTLGPVGRVPHGKGGPGSKYEADWASPSPSTDGKYVYAFDSSADFACFDFEGKEIWRFDALERYGKFKTNHGLHTTPLLHEGRLYLTLLQHWSHWVIAIDPATGKDIWKVARPTDAIGENPEAYTCPIVWHNGKETCLVVNGSDYVTGHSLKDGSEIWRFMGNPPANDPKARKSANRLIPTPVATPDLVVVCTVRGGGDMCALKPGGKGSIAEESPFLQWRKKKGSPDVASPIIHEGLIYTLDEGWLTCWDLKTGNQFYRERLYTGRSRASPILANGNLYVPERDEGKFHVVPIGPKFDKDKIKVNVLDDYFTASPAVANGRIYLHGFSYLYAIEEGAK